MRSLGRRLVRARHALFSCACLALGTLATVNCVQSLGLFPRRPIVRSSGGARPESISSDSVQRGFAGEPRPLAPPEGHALRTDGPRRPRLLPRTGWNGGSIRQAGHGNGEPSGIETADWTAPWDEASEPQDSEPLWPERPDPRADAAPAPALPARNGQARNEALELLKEARAALENGQVQKAWQKAAEAELLEVVYEVFDDRPDLVRSQITRTLAARQENAARPAPAADSADDGRLTVQVLQSPLLGAEPPPAAPPPRPEPPTDPLRPPHPATRPGSFDPPPPGAPKSGPIAAGRMLSFNFHEAPWDLVLRRFAQEIGLSLQMDVVPPGTLTYYDPRSYPASEVLDVLNGFLAPRNFLLLRRDNQLLVADVAKGLPVDLVPQVAPEEIARRGLNEPLCVVLPVYHTSAAGAAREIRPFLGPLGSVTPVVHSNRILVIDSGRNLRRIQQLLSFETVDPSRPVTTVFRLRNTTAVDVAKSVNEFLARSGAPAAVQPVAGDPAGRVLPATPVEREIMVVAEAKTNSLLVSAPPHLIDQVHRMICRLDAPPPQVLIQALLVEVELSNTDELGVEFGAQDSVLFQRSLINNILTVTESVANPVSGVVTSNQKIISQTATPGFAFNNSPLGNNVAINPGKVGTQGLSSFGTGRVNGDLGFGGLVLSAGSDSVNVLIRALSEKRKVDVLSRPQIRAIDNRPAEIQIGQQVPVVDGVSVTAVGNANPIIRQDKAGIILTVTPHIRPDGEVVIDVAAEKSAFNLARGAGVPIFTDAANGNVIEAPVKDITQAKTTVSVRNGQTIVLGGMITKSTIDVKRKVPCLGDIPIVGVAFRYTLDQVARRELLIFLTPQVIEDTLFDSERLKEAEIARTHFPAGAALQMHGPLFGPPGDGMTEEPFGQAGPGVDGNVGGDGFSPAGNPGSGSAERRGPLPPVPPEPDPPRDGPALPAPTEEPPPPLPDSANRAPPSTQPLARSSAPSPAASKRPFEVTGRRTQTVANSGVIRAGGAGTTSPGGILPAGGSAPPHDTAAAPRTTATSPNATPTNEPAAPKSVPPAVVPSPQRAAPPKKSRWYKWTHPGEGVPWKTERE